MSVPAPHFLLYSEAAPAAESAAVAVGRWRFVLQAPGGDRTLEAADEEQADSSERLELLAIVRGLEALDQPSKVTLMTGSRDIQRGLEFGLVHWREHDWQWERYGQMTPVKNGDLWRRIDRLLEIHNVACRPRRLEKADDLAVPERPAKTVRRAPGGRVLRMDQAEEKSEGRSTQHESNAKSKYSNGLVARCLSHWNFLPACLFRISGLVPRIFAPGGIAGK
jgi:ribonuclease HI